MASKVKLNTEIPPVTLPHIEQKQKIAFAEHRDSSSIAKVKAPPERFSASKPVLDKPLAAWQVIENVNRLEKTADKYAMYKEASIDRDFKKIENFYKEEALQLEKSIEVQNNVTFWDSLSDVGNMITSAASFFFGFSALSSGSAALGGALVVSGALSLTNIALKHTQGWDWVAETVAQGNEDLRHAVRTYLPAAVGIAAGAMALYGSFATWQYVGQTGMESTLSVIQGTAGIATALSSCAKGYYGSHDSWINAEVSSLQSMVELARLELENSVEELKEFHKKLMDVNECAGQIIQQTDHTVQVINQTV